MFQNGSHRIRKPQDYPEDETSSIHSPYTHSYDLINFGKFLSHQKDKNQNNRVTETLYSSKQSCSEDSIYSSASIESPMHIYLGNKNNRQNITPQKNKDSNLIKQNSKTAPRATQNSLERDSIHYYHIHGKFSRDSTSTLSSNDDSDSRIIDPIEKPLFKNEDNIPVQRFSSQTPQKIVPSLNIPKLSSNFSNGYNSGQTNHDTLTSSNTKRTQLSDYDSRKIERYFKEALNASAYPVRVNKKVEDNASELLLPNTDRNLASLSTERFTTEGNESKRLRDSSKLKILNILEFNNTDSSEANTTHRSIPKEERVIVPTNKDLNEARKAKIEELAKETKKLANLRPKLITQANSDINDLKKFLKRESPKRLNDSQSSAQKPSPPRTKSPIAITPFQLPPQLLIKREYTPNRLPQNPEKQASHKRSSPPTKAIVKNYVTFQKENKSLEELEKKSEKEEKILKPENKVVEEIKPTDISKLKEDSKLNLSKISQSQPLEEKSLKNSVIIQNPVLENFFTMGSRDLDESNPPISQIPSRKISDGQLSQMSIREIVQKSAEEALKKSIIQQNLVNESKSSKAMNTGSKEVNSKLENKESNNLTQVQEKLDKILNSTVLKKEDSSSSFVIEARPRYRGILERIEFVPKFIKTVKLIMLFKRRLKRRYFLNRVEYGKYDSIPDPPGIKVYNINHRLLKVRDQFRRQDLLYQEQEEENLFGRCEIEAWDLTSHKADKHEKSINIPANANMPHLGKVTKAGVINKVKAGTTRDHQRWLVLRGFDLYWYRTSLDKKAKGIIPLPTAPIKEIVIGGVKKKCMVLAKGKGREMIFLADYVGAPWKELLSNQIAWKLYMEYVREKRIEPKASLVRYFNTEDSKDLNIEDVILEHKTLPSLIAESLSYHHKLKELYLSNAGINGEYLERFMKGLIHNKKAHIEIMILDNNGITREHVNYINEYLQSESSFSLKKLSLSGNHLGDFGAQDLADGLGQRLIKINSDVKKELSLPILELILSDCKIGDPGLFGLVGLFDKILKKFSNRGFEVQKELMRFNLSHNAFSDNGLKAFAKMLKRFNGLSELDISHNYRLTADGFKYLIKALKKNYSLATLKYYGNYIDTACLLILLDSLNDNYILKNIGLTIKREAVDGILTKEELVMRYFNIM